MLYNVPKLSRNVLWRRIPPLQLQLPRQCQSAAPPLRKSKRSSTVLLPRGIVNSRHVYNRRETRAKESLTSVQGVASGADVLRPLSGAPLCQPGHTRAKDDDLHCELVEIVLDKPVQPFEAVSHACGDFNPTIPLYIGQGAHVFITENLAGVLRTFRYHDQDRFLWVDTVSINQSDTNEKSEQVGIMHKIYRGATVVQVWLGEADDQSSLAFSTLQQLADERGSYGVEVAVPFHDRFGDEEQKEKRMILLDNDEAGSAIYSLLNRAYFTRRWIVQEFALGRAIVINCGNYNLSWETLSYAYGVILTLKQQPFTGSKWMHRVRYHNAWAVLSMRIGKVYHDVGRDIGFPCRSLLHLLKANETARCREDHDLVYALLGLAEDDLFKISDARKILKPDYNQDIETTLHLVAYAYLFGARDPKVLHHVRSPQTLPLSFAPDWRVDTKTEQLGGYGRVSYKAGIGTNGQAAQIESRAGLPVLLGWYVDEIYLESYKSFQGEPANPVAYSCYLIAKWHSDYEKFRTSQQNVNRGDSYGFMGEDFNTASRG